VRARKPAAVSNDVVFADPTLAHPAKKSAPTMALNKTIRFEVRSIGLMRGLLF
jgi:hypothetical protein